MGVALRAALFSFALAAVAAAGSAEAQTPPAELEARALFDAGRQAAEEERHADALRLFERSLELHPTAAAAFNAAMSARRAGEITTGLRHVDALLEGAHGALPEARRAEVEALRRELRAEVGTLTVRVEPPETRVLIDGEEVDPERFFLAPPRQTITLVYPDGTRQEREVEVRAGERQTLQIVQPVSAPSIRAESSDGAPSDDTPAIVGVVIGAALVVGVAIAIGVAVHEESQLGEPFVGRAETLSLRF